MEDGQLELMVHRRIVQDDGRGVAEPLDERGQFGDGLIIRGKHYLMVDTIEKSASLHRTLGEQFMLRPHTVFILDDTSPKAFGLKYLTNVSLGCVLVLQGLV